MNNNYTLIKKIGIIILIVLILLNPFLAQAEDWDIPSNHSYSSIQNRVDEEHTNIKWMTPEIVNELSIEGTYSSNTQYFPLVVLDSRNNMHVLWEQGSEQLCHRVLFRNNNSWSKLYTIVNDTHYVTLPKMVVDSSNGIHVAWDNGRDIMYCFNNGEQWSEIITVIEDRNESSNVCEIAVDNELNRIYFVWDEIRNTSSRELYTQYYDFEMKNGSQITRLTNDQFWSVISGFSIDSKSCIHMIWSHPYESWKSSEVYYLMLDQNLEIIIPEQMISKQDDYHSRDAKLVLDSNDNLHVFWKDRNFYRSTNVSYRRMIDNQWQPIKDISEDGHTFTPDIYCDANDNIHFIWMEAGSDYSCFYYKKFIEQTEWSITQRLPYKQGELYPKLVVEDNNNVHVIFNHHSPGDFTPGINHLLGINNEIERLVVTVLSVTIPSGLFILVVLIIYLIRKK